MTDLYLGVDIGGTKSHAMLADQVGRVVGFGEGGAGNYETVGWEGLRQTLHDIVEGALSSAGAAKEQIRGAGFGIGGTTGRGRRSQRGRPSSRWVCERRTGW